MELALRQVGRSAVVSFTGRVDLEGEVAAEFRTRLKALIAEGHVNPVLDLSNVRFADSAGLGALIACLKAARQAEGSMALANPSDQVAAVLRVTRLTRVFEVHRSVEEALRAPGREPAASHG